MLPWLLTVLVLLALLVTMLTSNLCAGPIWGFLQRRIRSLRDAMGQNQQGDHVLPLWNLRIPAELPSMDIAIIQVFSRAYIWRFLVPQPHPSTSATNSQESILPSSRNNDTAVEPPVSQPTEARLPG